MRGQTLKRDLQSHLDGPVILRHGVRGALALPDVYSRERFHIFHH
jgi:hypothetical protein